MPREYFEGWFRNICICKPNYKKYFPKVYEALTLYKVISEYYKIDSGKSFFDSTQGNELIKTDIISKKNLESLKKVIQQINSNYSYVYDKESLSTIWYDGKNNIESSCNYFFVKEDDSFNVKIKKKQEINEDDFNYGQVFSPSISYHNRKDHCYRIIRLNQIDSISEIKPKKLTKNYSIPNFHKEPKIDVIPLLENNRPRYDYINPILGTESNYENPYVERNQNPFLNQLKKDLKHMEKYEDEIKEFLKEKYVFLGEGETENVNDGWIDISDGIILCSDDYFDNHYHVHFYGKKNNINLFSLIGHKFKCSCRLLKNGEIVKYCNRYFTFKKRVRFYNHMYTIDGVAKFARPPNYDEYILEKEKVKVVSKKKKMFII